MARQLRLDLPGIAQHVVQRGNDRQCVFFTDADRRRYLADLAESAQRHGVVVHAYVLMTNHVHLLATATTTGGISRTMQWLGRRYVPYVNAVHGRTGTLWEGRFKSCLVDSDRYLLACQRYIELNPVRAGMVATPGDHRWSSYPAYAYCRTDALLTPSPAFLALGESNAARARAWQGIIDAATGADELTAIREYLRQQRAWGSEAFQQRVESRLQRCAIVRAAHRPVTPKADKAL